MEVAIPGIALGLMYLVNKQSNNNEENFANRSNLPNVDIPNKNYPDEFPVESAVDDRTSALSNVNKIEQNGVYTDKFFDANMETNKYGKGEVNTNEQPEFFSLTGEKVNTSYYKHNNMVPYFGAKSSSGGASANSYESVLDNYTGSGSQHNNKKESAPLFTPSDNTDLANGAPNMNDFYQSRVNPSSRMANVKPFKTESVAPGLGLGYTNDGSDGFNSGMMSRDSWLPKTADDLRVTSNPKSSGHVLLGREGPAYSGAGAGSGNAPTAQQMGKWEQHKPDTAFELDKRSMNGKNDRNDIGRLFTTTGASKGQMLHAIPVQRDVNRATTSASYTGAAGSNNPNTYVEGEYMPSHNVHLGPVPIGVANAQGQYNPTESDYGIKSKKAYPNNRTQNKQESYFGAVRNGIGAAVAPLLDVLRPSRKENAVGSLRPYQNPGTSVPQSYIFNPADRPNTTIRETTEISKNHLNVDANQNGGAYYVTDHQAYDTNRQDTTVSYTGASGATAGTRKMKSFNAEYNQRNNDIKSSTIDGRLTKGNIKLNSSNINMQQNNRDELMKNSRPISGNMPYRSPEISTMGQLAGTDNSLYSQINSDRNNPDIMSSLKKNPYVVDYKNAL